MFNIYFQIFDTMSLIMASETKNLDSGILSLFPGRVSRSPESSIADTAASGTRFRQIPAEVLSASIISSTSMSSAFSFSDYGSTPAVEA